MSLLNRDNLVKLFAALLIIGFVVELFIVYTYTPPAPSQAASEQQQQTMQEDYVSSSLALLPPPSFLIRSFTGSLVFQCNASSLPEFNGILGKPVVIGASGDTRLFLARTANVSLVSDPLFLASFQEAVVKPVCGNVSVYREAAVVFNATSLEVISTLSPSNKTTIYKQQFDSYTNRFGLGPVALIADSTAVQNSRVELVVRLTLQNGQIVPDSLILEQQQQLPTSQSLQVTLTALVVSLTDNWFVIVSLPWENRFSKPFGDIVPLSEELRLRSEVALRGANVSAETEGALRSLSFVTSVKKNGSDLMLEISNTTNSTFVANEITILGNFSLVFPASVYIAQFNSTPPSPVFPAVFLRQAILTPVNRTVNRVELPLKFPGLLYSNVSVNQTVSVKAQVSIENGEVTGVRAREDVAAASELS